MLGDILLGEDERDVSGFSVYGVKAFDTVQTLARSPGVWLIGDWASFSFSSIFGL